MTRFHRLALLDVGGLILIVDRAGPEGRFGDSIPVFGAAGRSAFGGARS